MERTRIRAIKGIASIVSALCCCQSACVRADATINFSGSYMVVESPGPIIRDGALVSSGGNTADAKVKFRVLNGTAKANRDFKKKNGIITFQPGQLEQMLNTGIEVYPEGAGKYFFIELRRGNRHADIGTSSIVCVTIDS